MTLKYSINPHTFGERSITITADDGRVILSGNLNDIRDMWTYDLRLSKDCKCNDHTPIPVADVAAHIGKICLADYPDISENQEEKMLMVKLVLDAILINIPERLEATDAL